MNGEITKTLIDARALIARPENHCKGFYYAVKDDGTETYCAYGAIHTAAGSLHKRDSIITPCSLDGIETTTGYLAYKCVVFVAGNMNLAKFNDEHTHAEVLQVFDQAINKATKEGL